MATRLENLLRDARERQRILNSAERTRDAAAAKRDLALFIAQEAGATYRQMEKATGLSTARITQVLRRARLNKNT